VREADILVHVVDIAHPGFEDHIAAVNDTLHDIGSLDKPIIMVFNKIDAFTYEPKEEDDLSPITRNNFSLEDWKRSWMARHTSPVVFISAVEREHIDVLRQVLTEQVRSMHMLRYPNYLPGVEDTY
jgi:GTP-binding protein HflX